MATKEQILKRVSKKVEKLNQFVTDCINECGGEHELYLDNSSTIIETPEYCEPNYNIKDGALYCGDNYLCGAICFDDEENDWYEDFELADFIKYEKSCIRKGVRYFKEFNPEIENDPEKVEEFYYNL